MTTASDRSIINANDVEGGNIDDRREEILWGGTPELNDAALDDDALEAVSGGKKVSMEYRADQAWDVVKEMFGANEGTEEQP